ncbi:MAG: polysaccharide ABC transporter ATP-binding protein [Deltaproteobacteria bacterium]|nr:polysaccharide ABC transporter ATP-binding protein [Deltaproteobacteria bacterium]
MSSIAIRVENLSKQYRIGGQQKGYKTLRDTLTETLISPFRRAGGLLRGQPYGASKLDETIWALKDVSFEIKRGEVVGIIGRNGAGKTTLLKILSRISEPTEGQAEIRGRVGSLLEVGTGFHPELTGRENIYLNGAILGMKKAEIERKFDEMVDFAEIERFIDTPVKHYSSGMYVRLAFAVAAHLEPEILLVDEVLSVGDAAFQKKCLGKMGSVAQEGRTILFVSHNMIAVRNLCSRAIWLQDGFILHSGATSGVVDSYLRENSRTESIDAMATIIRSLPSDPAFRLDSVDIRQDGRPGNVVVNGQPVEVAIQYSVLQRTTGLRVYFDLCDDHGNILIRTFHDDDANAIPTVDPGDYESTAVIPANLLSPRTYELRIRATIFNVRTCTGDGIGILLQVEASSGINRGYPQDVIRSALQPKIPWRTRKKA